MFLCITSMCSENNYNDERYFKIVFLLAFCFQNNNSVLLDAYKKTDLDEKSNLAIFAVSSISFTSKSVY